MLLCMFFLYYSFIINPSLGAGIAKKREKRVRIESPKTDWGVRDSIQSNHARESNECSCWLDWLLLIRLIDWDSVNSFPRTKQWVWHENKVWPYVVDDRATIDLRHYFCRTYQFTQKRNENKIAFCQENKVWLIVYVVDAGAQETFATICTKIILWISNKRYWDSCHMVSGLRPRIY